MISRVGRVELRRGRCPRTARVLSVLVLALLVVGGGTGAASASPGSVFSAARAARSESTFCQLMAIFGGSPAESPAVLKSGSEKIKSLEPTMLSLAPSAIKKDLQKVIALDNVSFSELAKVNYNVAKIPSSFAVTLKKDQNAVKPAFNALASYVDKACGLKFPPLQG